MGVAGAAMATTRAAGDRRRACTSARCSSGTCITLKSLFCVPATWANIGAHGGWRGGAVAVDRAEHHVHRRHARDPHHGLHGGPSSGPTPSPRRCSRRRPHQPARAAHAGFHTDSAEAERREILRGGIWAAKKVADRLLIWGFLLGCSRLQFAALPALQFFTPLQNVQEMAKLPVLIGAVQMPLNGLVFVAEGLDAGPPGVVMRLAEWPRRSTTLMMGALKIWGTTVEGVWCCFFVQPLAPVFRLQAPLLRRPARARKSCAAHPPKRSPRPWTRSAAAEDVAAGFGRRRRRRWPPRSTPQPCAGRALATAGLNLDDESDEKGALRRALRTPQGRAGRGAWDTTSVT